MFDGARLVPHQLFVNGRRCPRTRLPKEGFYWITGVQSEGQERDFSGAPASHSFFVNPGDIKPWQALDDVDIVVLHYWVEERMPIGSFDPATNCLLYTSPSPRD